MRDRYPNGTYVRVVGSPSRPVPVAWVGVSQGLNGPPVASKNPDAFVTYRVTPMNPQPGELDSYWREWELEPASLLEALAEAASE